MVDTEVVGELQDKYDLIYYPSTPLHLLLSFSLSVHSSYPLPEELKSTLQTYRLYENGGTKVNNNPDVGRPTSTNNYNYKKFLNLDFGLETKRLIGHNLARLGPDHTGKRW